MLTTRLVLPGFVAAALALSMTPAALGADARAGAARKATPFEVTAKASTSELVLGRKVVFTGRVSPRSAGKTVKLQKRIGDNPWKVETKTTLSARGKFVMSDRPTTMEPRKYRVVKPASKRHDKGVSEAMPVTMYQWQDVYNLNARDADGVFATDTVTIDTVDFANSLRSHEFGTSQGADGFIDYNIRRQCTKLDATYGMDDDADVDSAVQIDVLADGTNLYSGTFAFLESEHRKVDLHGVFRLAFEWTRLSETQPVAAVGSPRVLCSF